MRTSIKVKRAIKKFLIENDQKADKRWKSRKAQKGLLIIAGTIAIITIGNILINIAQAAPESLVYENKHIDFGTGIETESAEDTPEQKDEAEDGIAVNSISQMIAEKFPENTEIVTAVFKAESGHRADAMGWNCYYNGRSQACLPQDRSKAWSVDCGVAQINHIGKDCPEELFDPEHNLTVAKKMYDSRGLTPWYAYLNGAFKKFMN